MPDVDAVLQPDARRFYDSIKRPADQRRLDSIIRSICEDPRIDEDLKFSVPSRDRTMIGYGDGMFIVMFEHLNSWTISIANIAYDKDFIPWDDID